MDEKFVHKTKDIREHHQGHWFEVGDKEFSNKDINMLAENCGLRQVRSFHSSSLPYHYFILFEKTPDVR